MIIDKELLFSNNQEITKTVESAVVDFGEAGDAIGQELTFHAVVTGAFTGLTSLAVSVQTSDDGETFSDVIMTPAIKLADLAVGKDIFCVRLPKGLKRFVGLKYTVVGTGSGKLTAFASKDL